MSPESDTKNLIQEALRVVKLRAEQMASAALCRDAGDIDSEDWDGFAARYAAAVRELRVLQHIRMTEQPALAETKRGRTWVQA